jgi:cbb3-type cytochrome oxidase subunit 3
MKLAFILCKVVLMFLLAVLWLVLWAAMRHQH